jgi:hypothetical protein
VFNSRESATICHASQQSGMMNFVPLGSNHSAVPSQHGSMSRGMQSPANSLPRGQVRMSMLESDPNILLAHLMQHRRHSSPEDVKREFSPILLHKICLTGIDPSEVNHLLHVILESSDVFEVLHMRCFDQVLHQRIMEAHLIEKQNDHARFAMPKSLARDEGSASISYPDFRSQLEAGSARLQTPSPQVKSIIRDLLCGRVEEAAGAFLNLQCDSNTQISDVRSNKEKVKFITFKNAGTGKDESPVESLLWTWEREFDVANLEPQVSRVLGLMTPGGNLSSWSDSFRSISRDPKDPEDIRNWKAFVRADPHMSLLGLLDSAKPTVPHVTAQAVQDNMTSPCDQLISENNNQAQEDQRPESTTSPAKTYTYNSSTMSTSNAFHGGRARATFARGRSTDLSAGFTPMVSSNDTPVNVTPVNHYDDDDADIFFDVCEVLGNDENDNKDPSPQMSSRFPSMSFARRAAQIGKFARIALKYIATHELAGVLQPISSIRKSPVYIPKRQLQGCLMLLIFMCTFCMTISMTLSGHRTYIDTVSTLSHMVTPLVFHTTLSSVITGASDWYESVMNTLTKTLFPTSPRRFSNLLVSTRDPYYACSSLRGDDLFQNITMTGLRRNIDMEAALVCLHLNFETKNSKIGMFDSGCNNAMQVLTDDVRECVVDFDTNGRIMGDQVSGEFTTDASGTIGITLNGVSPTGSTFAFDFIVEKMQLVRNLSYNLLPVSFFTRRGCDVFFHGRQSIHDHSQAGVGDIRLHELKPNSRDYMGKVDLKSWNDLWFFNYSIFGPAHDVPMTASVSNGTKISNTIKAHVTFGHASGRRVHGTFKHASRGDEIFSDLKCTCQICAVTKS